MELYAAGFNAWNQLSFEDADALPEAPDDRRTFEVVLKNSAFEHIHASTSCTLIKTASEVLAAGYLDEWAELHDLRDSILSSKAAIAGNGIIVVWDGDQTIHQYQCLDHFKANNSQYTFTGLHGIIKLVAYETGFAALSTYGRVWTWGDERYATCLGRDVSDSPAHKPGPVVELDGLPTGKIKKLAAGGYLVIALTEGNDLYAWGGHPGRPTIIEDLSGSPSPVLVDEKDILDCAAGESHAIVLTADGDVYVVGENVNGQLGLAVEKTASWVKLPWDLPRSFASSVAAGPKNSFIVTSIDFS